MIVDKKEMIEWGGNTFYAHDDLARKTVEKLIRSGMDKRDILNKLIVLSAHSRIEVVTTRRQEG